MSRDTRRTRLRAEWAAEYEMFMSGPGYFADPARLARRAARVLKKIPGPVDRRRRAG